MVCFHGLVGRWWHYGDEEPMFVLLLDSCG
jgi:hypothetical protein